jgi:hypothetical protein
MFIGEKNVSNKSFREDWNTFYFQYTFPQVLTIFEIIKQKDSYAYILECAYSTNNHGLLNTVAIKKGIKTKEGLYWLQTV